MTRIASARQLPADIDPLDPNPRVVMGGNRPPLEEAIVEDFNESYAAEPGLKAKVDALVARVAEGAPDCTDEDMAGRYGDFIKQARTCGQKIDAIREQHNRPLLTAQRTLKARADTIKDQLATASNKVLAKVDAFRREQDRIADEKRRQAEAEARAAREAAEAERQRQIAAMPADAEPDDLPPPVEIAAVEVEKPVFRGDQGARVGTRTVWLHEIESVRKLPDAILKHPKVLEALNSVVGARVRGGEHDIKGCRIWSEQKTDVR